MRTSAGWWGGQDGALEGGRRGGWARDTSAPNSSPASLCTHGDDNGGVMIPGWSWDFVAHSGRQSMSPCQPRGQSRSILAPRFPPASELLYFGGPLGKAISV